MQCVQSIWGYWFGIRLELKEHIVYDFDISREDSEVQSLVSSWRFLIIDELLCIIFIILKALTKNLDQ